MSESNVITRISKHPGTLPSPREEDIPETALTVLHGFSPEALAERAAKHRAEYEEAATRQGLHLPSESELDRWFGV